MSKNKAGKGKREKGLGEGRKTIEPGLSSTTGNLRRHDQPSGLPVHKQIFPDEAVSPLEVACQQEDSNCQLVLEVACTADYVRNQDLHLHLEEDLEVDPRIDGVACAPSEDEDLAFASSWQ